MIGLRETLLALFLWLGQDPVSADITSVIEAEPAEISCQGQAIQAGLLICSAPTATHLEVSGINGEAWRRIPVNADGLATVGLLRTEAKTVQITAVGASLAPLTLDVATRTDPFRIIEGMDCDKVDARTDAQKAHAGRSWVKKQDAFQRFEAGQGGVNGFARPARGRMSSPFGPARKYIGVGVDGVPCERTRIHYGYDIATPVGTPIYAPAAGIVTLGDPDLYYEGGTIFLDHGEGLVSVFMHMSEIQVEAGQSIAVGEQIGLSGNTGRTTGPHLHWAVKWRNPSSDDRSRDFYVDPALLMQMAPVDFETPVSGQE